MRRTVLIQLVLFAFFATACDASPQGVDANVVDSGRNYVPGEQWRTARAQDLGFDSTKLASALQDAASGRWGSLHGVVVIRNGYVAAEQYTNWNPATSHTMQSVTKSVTSLLFGIMHEKHPQNTALQRGLLETLSRYEPGVANKDARKTSITLRDMLTMRTGIDFYEQPYPGSPLEQLNRSSSDWVKLVLDRPMISQPGSAWAYNSGSPIVMCGVIREITGERVADFARRELFDPLGIRNAFWFVSPYDSLTHCGGGLNLRATDLARIGYLVLRDGRWGDRRIVSEAWIDESTAAVSTGPSVYFNSYNASYGYYWWGFPRRRGGSDHDVIAASGSGGQWLFIVPALDIVVAIIAENGNGLDLFYDGVMAAVR